MNRHRRTRLLALAAFACCLAALVLARASQHGASGYSPAGPLRLVGQHAAGVPASPSPAAAAASSTPPTTLEAVCTAELLCRLAGSGRRHAAQRLLCTPRAWPLPSMRALAGMRFTSARVMAPVQGGRVRLSIRVRVPGGAAAQSTRTLVFVLRAEPEGWRAASVRPVRVVRGSSGG